MKTYTLRYEQIIPCELIEAWDFFSSPFNLARITPSLGFVITSDLRRDQKMYPGILISYKVAPFLGIKIDWLTEITHIKEYEYFVDEQRFGPFAFWHHQHHFAPHPYGVRMTDLLSYGMPLGSIGKIANALFVEKKVMEIFTSRKEKIREIFSGRSID